MNSSAVAALRKISLFSGLVPSDLRRIAALARLHQAPRESMIFEKKTAGNHLFIVLKGRIKIYSELPHGHRKKTFAYLEAGDFFGEISLLDQQGRSLSACALVDSELLTIGRKDFQNLIDRQPRFALNVLKTVVYRLRKTNEEIESLTFRSLYGRICRKIVEISGKYAKNGHKTNGLIPIQITHNELADLTGTAREMVTKVLSSLRRLRVIEYEDRHIRILNTDKLRELAQTDL
ncbi:MAG: Crp/Fnr family transcriptional regulator [Elusimicrobia bacterium]|nr:Crp/Fnr family transcriptional regulator [Elusimicrobiota bacterium]